MTFVSKEHILPGYPCGVYCYVCTCGKDREHSEMFLAELQVSYDKFKDNPFIAKAYLSECEKLLGINNE